MLHILLADDHAIVSGLLARELAREPDFLIVGIATKPQQIDEYLRQNRVDLLLLDLYLGPDIRDLSLARQLQTQYPQLSIVILTGETRNVRFIHEANKMGLAGYLGKTIAPDELVYTLRKVEQGQRVFSPDVLQILLSGPGDLPQLTPTETAIIDLLTLGMKRDAICKKLGFTAKSTYDTHVQHLKEKFGVTSTNELLRKAVESGYV